MKNENGPALFWIVVFILVAWLGVGFALFAAPLVFDKALEGNIGGILQWLGLAWIGLGWYLIAGAAGSMGGR